MIRLSVGSAALMLSMLPCVEAQSPPIPSQFQDAYNTVNTNVNNFSATINANWSGARSPVLYTAQLLTAGSDLTTTLLQANYYQSTVLPELNSLQALGVQGVTFHVNFPGLYGPYYSDQADFQSYLNFYTTLVNEIRSRGLKLVIENTTAVSYPGTNGGSFLSYYQSLDWPTYMSQRSQLATFLAQTFKPDYLVLVAEPDTEAADTGQPNANTVSGSTQMVQQMIADIQANGPSSVQLSAGCGTWNPLALQYYQSFIGLPLPIIDMHVYPVNVDNLPTALTAAQMILAAGKQPSMSELWDYKETDADYQGNLSYITAYARDVFSFWASTDTNFLQTMEHFANYQNFAFMTPFWSCYFGSYLDYNTVGGQPDATLITTETNAAYQSRAIGGYTPTAIAWENMVIPAADTVPPISPPAPSLGAVGQINANINLNRTTDNIGVAAYNVYRNGALVGTLNSPLVFHDSGLSPKTTYAYTAAAFDASGNLSPQSPPLLVTTFSYPDKTPPSVPTAVQATAFSDTQISLTWTPSVDNVAVMMYEIFRGTTRTNLVPWGTSPVNSFLDLHGAPATTYYYQVLAIDTSGNQSAKSGIATGATQVDTNPPTTPGNVSVLATSGPEQAVVTWTASVDEYAVGSYSVYRGTSTNNMIVIGGVSAKAALTFTDTRITPDKMYYYAVAAFDASRNQSALSTPILITAP